jgi:hypothetical protein
VTPEFGTPEVGTLELETLNPLDVFVEVLVVPELALTHPPLAVPELAHPEPLLPDVEDAPEPPGAANAAVDPNEAARDRTNRRWRRPEVFLRGVDRREIG